MYLIRKFFDLGNVLIVLEMVEDFEESLEEQCSLPVLPLDQVDHVEDVISCLPVVRKLGQSGSSPDQHVQVVQGGDGCGEVPLGRVQLLDVGGDVADHGLRLGGFGLDLLDLDKELNDGGLGLIQGGRGVVAHRRLTADDASHLLVHRTDLAFHVVEHTVQIGQRLLGREHL